MSAMPLVTGPTSPVFAAPMEPREPRHWNSSTMPQRAELSRSYSDERALQSDAEAMALGGWRLVRVRLGPARRRLIDRLRLKRLPTRSAHAFYLRQ